jgi:N-methylhydantoinase A
MANNGTLRTAIDIGGTFTDLASYDVATRSVRFEKALSTPDSLDRGVLECFEKGSVDPAAMEQFIHGSTVAINAIIQKTGARTALITTDGFTDVYEIGRANRPDTYNLFFEKPAPLIPATLRFGIAERVGPDGKVLTALTATAIDGVVKKVKAANVQAVAVCLLHSYANIRHEAAIGRAIRAALPDVFVTLSHEILREYREYERTSTTVLNAYVGHQVSGYLRDLERPLRDRTFTGRFLIMQSNGGVMTAKRASQVPVAMMESGPAGGIIGAAELGKLIGDSDVIAFDMGGTTAKTCLVEQGLPKMTDQYYIGGYRDGYPMRIPAVDIIEVGAGGGSIAWIDAGGALKVGPQSAGSAPGPVCYARGGVEPTVTDANLVTGRLNPTRFLGGEFDLDMAGAQAAIAKRIGTPLGMDVLDTACGIIRITDARMSFAVRAITLQRGYDPRRFAMVAFGGAGPLHAMAIARELHIPRVIIPPQPGHFSALGMLLTDLRQDFVQTRVTDLAGLNAADLNERFTALEKEGRASIAREGYAPEAVTLLRSMDMRYLGQEYTVRVSVPDVLSDRQVLKTLREHFDVAYDLRYGHSSPDQPAQIVNFRVTAIGRVEKPDLASLQDKRIPAASTACERQVYFEGKGHLLCPVAQRAALTEGTTIEGPAIIEEYASTTVLHPGDRAIVNQFGCLVITTGGQ